MSRIPVRAVAEGDRVFLRYPVPSDQREYLLLRRRSRRFLEPWEATPVGGPSPFSATAFGSVLKTRRTATGHRLLVCDLNSHAILGQISLGGIGRGAFQSAFVGYWIGEPYARNGYMTEALSLTLTFAFGSLGLHRVEANIIPTNAPSLGLVKRLGFRYEGTARRYLRINGDWRDHEHWAMCAEEWPPASRTGAPRQPKRAVRHEPTARTPARSPAST